MTKVSFDSGWAVEVLTILLVILKAVGVFPFDWWVVFLPIIIKYGIAFGITVFALGVTLLYLLMVILLLPFIGVAILFNPSLIKKGN